MKESVRSEYDELEQYAHSIGMTLEEYAISLHKKNQQVKSVLLESGPEFKQFVNDFHKTLDDLAIYKESGAKKQTCDHYQLIKKVVHLLKSSSTDPKLLAQLYRHYPNGIEEELNNLNKRIG